MLFHKSLPWDFKYKLYFINTYKYIFVYTVLSHINCPAFFLTLNAPAYIYVGTSCLKSVMEKYAFNT